MEQELALEPVMELAMALELEPVMELALALEPVMELALALAKELEMEPVKVLETAPETELESPVELELMVYCDRHNQCESGYCHVVGILYHSENLFRHGPNDVGNCDHDRDLY
jgi:hypothetical protein